MRWLASTLIAMSLGCSGGNIGKEGKPIVVVNNDVDDMGSPVDASGGDDGGGTDVDLGGPTTEPDGPMILDFSASPARLTENGSVNVTANLSDPQGFDDIGGGRVLDRNDEVVGVFGGSGGTFSFALSWTDVHALDPISFEDEEQRVFTAEFFDAANHRARQSFAITLHCDGLPACDGSCGLTECGGECVDPEGFADDPDNCGMCGRVCPGGFCEAGECLNCRPIEDSIGPCDPLCQTGCAAGEACLVGGSPQSPQSLCLAAGTTRVGQACTAPDECVAGAICAGTDPENALCVAFCRLGGGDPSCAAGTTCQPVGPSLELGLCVPS